VPRSWYVDDLKISEVLYTISKLQFLKTILNFKLFMIISVHSFLYFSFHYSFLVLLYIFLRFNLYLPPIFPFSRLPACLSFTLSLLLVTGANSITRW